jgi:hypothetical protein
MSDETRAKIYYKNALSVIPRLAEQLKENI